MVKLSEVYKLFVACADEMEDAGVQEERMARGPYQPIRPYELQEDLSDFDWVEY